MFSNTVKSIITLTMFVAVTFAQTFSVQGVLRDPVGRTVEDGYYAITFHIYTVPTGGTALWTESHGSVDVKHGVFAVELGLVSSMADLSFDTQYYIGISVEDDQELDPRIKLTSAPSSYGVFGVNNTFPSTGNVGVGTHDPNAGLHIQTQEANDDLLKVESGNAEGRFITVDNDGKMGLNVDPEQALDIDGNLKMRNGSIMFDDGSSLSSAYFGGSASSLTNSSNIIITTDSDDNGTGEIQFISGSAPVVTIENDGNTSFVGDVSAAGDVSATNLTASGDVTITGTTIADSVNAASITASGNVSAGSLNLTAGLSAGGNVTAGSITSSGSMNADGLNLTAGLNAGGNITADGEITAPKLSVDPNYYQQIQEGDPVVGFDAYDWLQFNRESNTYAFNQQSASKLTIGPDEVESLVNLIAPNIMHKVVEQTFTADGTIYSVSIPGDQYARFRVVAKFNYDYLSGEPHLALRFNGGVSNYTGITRQHWHSGSETEWSYSHIPIARQGYHHDTWITCDFLIDKTYGWPTVTGTFNEAPIAEHPGSTGTFGGTWKNTETITTMHFFIDAAGAQLLDGHIVIWAMP